MGDDLRLMLVLMEDDQVLMEDNLRLMEDDLGALEDDLELIIAWTDGR